MEPIDGAEARNYRMQIGEVGGKAEGKGGRLRPGSERQSDYFMALTAFDWSASSTYD